MPSALPASGGAGTRGVIVSLGSSLAFGLIYFLTPLLRPMSAEGVWAIRALFTLPFITVVLLMSREWHLVVDIARRIRRRPAMVLALLVSSVLLAAQLWLFSWAPLNGRGMQVALGYFLLPLVLVVIGRLLYRDRMVWWQWAAAGIAGVGVVFEILRVGGIGWETLLVCLGYPCYFVLRRSMGTGHLGGMWWDFACLYVVAVSVTVLGFADGSVLQANPMLWWAAPAVSIFSAFALLLYLLASRLLSMSLFGLLSYAEPALLVVASLLIGEQIAPGEWFTYGAIWTAVLVLVIGGALEMRRSRGR